MSVSVEKTSNFGRQLTIEVPASLVQAEEKKIVAKLAQTADTKGGFMRGSPKFKEHLKKKYKQQIRSEAINNQLQDSLDEALKKQNLRPANTPNIEDVKCDEGQDLKYTVSFEVFPEIQLADFAQIELEKEVAEITEAEIDNGVQKLQEQFATFADAADQPAKMGDVLTIDFVGLLNGEPFENGSSENFDIELGSKRLIPGFEEGLVGLSAGADKTLDISFPTDYGAADLAGKAVQFNINVKKVQSRVPAEVNEDFAKRIGIEDKDVNKIRPKIFENMIKFMDDTVAAKLREQALEKLYAVHNIELPQSLIDNEKHNMQHEKHGHGRDVECSVAHGEVLSAEEDAKLSADAKKRVTLGLLLNEVIAKNKIQPDEARVMAKLRSMALMYGGHAEFIQKMFYESKEFRQNVLNMVLTDQAADLIVSGATIKEKQSTFNEIVKAQLDS